MVLRAPRPIRHLRHGLQGGGAGHLLRGRPDGARVRIFFLSYFHFTRIRENQIDIRTANYGCLNSAVCPAEGLLTAICSARTSLEVVRDRCQGMTSCAVLADDSTFVDDSCPSFVSKSLEVSYACEQTAGK